MTRIVVWMIGDRWFESVQEAQRYKKEIGSKDELRLMYLERLPSRPESEVRKEARHYGHKPPSNYDPTKPLPAILEQFK